MKHSITSLWYVSQLRCCDALMGFYYVFNYFVMSSVQQVFTSHLSIKSSSKIFQYQPRGKQEEQDYKLEELLFYLKTTTYTNIFIFIAQIYAFLNKILYEKNTNKRFPLYSKTSNFLYWNISGSLLEASICRCSSKQVFL